MEDNHAQQRCPGQMSLVAGFGIPTTPETHKRLAAGRAAEAHSQGAFPVARSWPAMSHGLHSLFLQCQTVHHVRTIFSHHLDALSTGIRHRVSNMHVTTVPACLPNNLCLMPCGELVQEPL
jgi:hypothetical protein